MSGLRRVLLLSTSTIYGGGYLEYAVDELTDFLRGARCLLFVPFALRDHAAYAARARAVMEKLGVKLISLHDQPDKQQAMSEAEALFIGGGNTFRLLKSLYDLDLIEPVRQRVDAGLPYLGSSAGSNVAGPTIKTTNDMPIVQPPSFEALGLVPFQINPHYVDPETSSRHMGETREERIVQYLEENDTPVLGLREGAMVRLERATCQLRGTAGARLFRQGAEPVELSPGADLSKLLV